MTWLERDGARLHLREIGHGRPMIVLHGGPDFDHEYLLPDLDRLADLARLVYYDQRGRGRSYSGEKPDDVSLSTDVADLDRVREWAEPGSVALLGHSWGTLLALEYALRHPARVSHLVLLNPAPASHVDLLAVRRHLTALRSADEMERMAELRSDPAYRAGELAADAEYHRIHFRPTVRRSGDLERIVGRLRRGFTREGIVAARAIEHRLYEETWLDERYDLLPRLGDVRSRTVVIRGEHDFIPIEVARHIADGIPDARLVDLPNSGHFAYVEQPDAVHAAIAGLLFDG